MSEVVVELWVPDLDARRELASAAAYAGLMVWNAGVRATYLLLRIRGARDRVEQVVRGHWNPVLSDDDFDDVIVSTSTRR